MLGRISFCVVLGGCGFSARAVGDDPPPPPPDDAREGVIEVDAPAMPAKDCWSQWLDGPLALSTPRPLEHQSDTSVTERDPWVSPDGLRLYYACDPNGAPQSQVCLATRTKTEDPFGTGDPVTNVNVAGAAQGGASLTEDELTLILTSDRPGGSQFDFYLSTRGDRTATFPSGDVRFLGAVNAPGTQHFDPSLTADGLKLYLAPIPPGGVQHIFLSTRATPADLFDAPRLVPVVNDATKADADPAVSRDERVIVFSSFRPTGVPATGATNLWYATRHDPTADFGPPRPIPDVNSDKDDGDPRLADDGCTLYFSSNRDGTTRDLYRATVAP
ncbi:MAG TPA: hypothetical protein VFT22_31720 [Kofleriaceae bacterium]|nr:hypothetical protein [Kofleriaceae bacterium]